MRMTTLGELFTDAEIKRMQELYTKASPGTFAKRCANEIIEPLMARINAVTGQENSALYLAYAAEFAFSSGKKGAK